jgi:hypothetical protein
VVRSRGTKVMATVAKKARAYGLMVAGGDVWAWVIDRFHERARAGLANANSLVELWPNQKAPGPFGELTAHCAQEVTKAWSAAFFGATRRKKAGQDAGLPLRRRFWCRDAPFGPRSSCIGKVPRPASGRWPGGGAESGPHRTGRLGPGRGGGARRPGATGGRGPEPAGGPSGDLAGGQRGRGLDHPARPVVGFVDERGTSSRCPTCGSSATKSGRTLTCSSAACRRRHHRDVAGSQNIAALFGAAPTDIAHIEHRRAGTPARRDHRRQLYDRRAKGSTAEVLPVPGPPSPTVTVTNSRGY